MSPQLDPLFLGPPLAHRGLHDRASGRPENSPAAFRAAIEHGYGIECDVQLSSDGEAMVFHDYALGRLTRNRGPIAGRLSADLGKMKLKGSDEGIPTLAEVLAIVRGRVALLIELKDQDGAMGPNVGRLEAAVVKALAGYGGPVAVMSFSPPSVAELARLAPDLTRGLTTSPFRRANWPLLAAAVRDELRLIRDYDAVGASFISHDVRDLSSPRVKELKSAGAKVLCWTVHSEETEREARQVADNITFEGYLPARPV